MGENRGQIRSTKRGFSLREWLDKNDSIVFGIPALLLAGWLLVINAGLGVVMIIIIAEVLFVARL